MPFLCLWLIYLFRVSATFHMIWLSYYFGKVDLPFFFPSSFFLVHQSLKATLIILEGRGKAG